MIDVSLRADIVQSLPVKIGKYYTLTPSSIFAGRDCSYSISLISVVLHIPMMQDSLPQHSRLLVCICALVEALNQALKITVHVVGDKRCSNHF